MDGENVPIAATDIGALVEFAKSSDIGLTVVGPDDALAAGMVDAFQAAGLRIFGPPAAGARLESSKAFAKDFMRRHGIPTAQAREFTESAEAHAACIGARYPLVIKADGLALGKGVVIAQTPQDAAFAIHRMMDLGVFGEAGRRVVIEEFLSGLECSIHALVDGESSLLFPDCRDHKAAFEGNTGPNTGGMGTLSPSGGVATPEAEAAIHDILARFVRGIQTDAIPFRGMLFPGLILTEDGPRVLEFNCRFGDPETQVLMRRLRSDLLDLLEAAVDGTLADQHPDWDARFAVCVVLVAGGYPGGYRKGDGIDGLSVAAAMDDVVVFHAGTREEAGRIVTNGGRVVGVTALGDDLASARAKAYAAADAIRFDGMRRREDIGAA
jgi:phosphoribosylamine--glycine ligase